MMPSMEKVPGDCEQDGRPVPPQLPRVRFARRTPVEGDRLSGGWSRDLTVLDGGALHRLRPAQSVPAISVLIAEPMGLVRAGLRSLLEREQDITVVGEAAWGEEAVALAAATRPDVVLMDIELPGLGALGATRQIRADSNLSQVRVAILTADEREEDLFSALGSGASGFLVLDAEPVELLRAVRVVAGGGVQLSPWATRRLLEEFASIPDPASSSLERFEELTVRERDIVLLVALGLTNGEIAQRLVISPATVKTHVSRAIVKLHARDRAKLVALAYQTGFVTHHHAADASVARDRASLRLAAGNGV
jgi:DNA-binding NarL/FixJ family response regulator